MRKRQTPTIADPVAALATTSRAASDGLSDERPRPAPRQSTRRETFGLISAAGAAALVDPRRLRAGELPTFRIGTLPYGTVQWEVQTIVDRGLDRAAGVRILNVPLASNEAARVAFLSGSVDAIINDLLFAARLKAEGKAIQFLPFSTKEGALMARASSPIRGLADLKGRSIGVAGGPLDKSWLVLRAAATKEGVDLAREARPVYGAPPLLAAKVESGELDCGLLYWSACARLAAKGYREVVSVEELADRLGARGRIAFVGFLFNDGAPEAELAGVARAVRGGERLLADDPAAWTAVRPLMEAKDEATFDALKRAFIEGIPHKGRAEEIRDASDFFAVMVQLGGTALVGDARSLPADLYVAPAVYG